MASGTVLGKQFRVRALFISLGTDDGCLPLSPEQGGVFVYFNQIGQKIKK
jgi:hypothetical protein